MTDKQIIINGVDVSGCAERSMCINCETVTNCYYKQLKRKEQECERLKQGYAELTEIVSPYMDDFTGYNEELGGFDIVLCVKELLEQFKKECENWESLCKHADKQIDELQAELEALKSFDINLVGIKECEIRQLVRYRKVLTEIKEVLQFYNNTTIGIDKGNGIFEFEVSNDNVLGGKLIYRYDTNPAKEALQKIKEVE